MELPIDEWFQLPFLGTDVFVALMRARLQYDRAARRFMITDRTNADQVLAVLSTALKQPVKLRVEVKNPSCFVCAMDVQCDQCLYNEICPKTPPYCLCVKHSGAQASFEEYSGKFVEAAQIPSLYAIKTGKDTLHADGIWTEKYRPAHLIQMVGNEKARIEFLRWIQKWKPKSKPALLLGPPGTGKTTLVGVASRDLGYELIQLNASDERSKSKLEKSLLPGIVNQPLGADWSNAKRINKRLIFLDEIDGLYGRADFGAAPFLKELLPQSNYPVVMAANNEDSDVVQQLAGSGSMNTFQFHRALPRQVELYLREILRVEGVSIDESALQMIVERANGDLRAAINNLEMVARNAGAARILNYRDEQISRRESFKRLLAAKNQRETYEALELLPIGDLRELMQLAASNLLANPIEPRKRAHAFELLSRLDLLIWRIQSTQNWTLLRYVRRILAGILFNVKNDEWRIVEDDPDFQKIRFRVWNDRKIIAGSGRKISDAAHVSLRTALAEFYTYLLIAYTGEGEKKVLEELLAFDESSARMTDREIQQIENLLEAAPSNHAGKK